MQNRTSIVVAHRLSTIQRADQIIVLHHGEIREQGKHQQLLAEHGLYWMLYKLQYSDEGVPPVMTGPDENATPQPISDFFFFQAEDGIRDGTVTGVQTCALPICCVRHTACVNEHRCYHRN